MLLEQAQEIFANVRGASFVGVDFETVEPLTGGRKNAMQGRVTKRTINTTVQVFQNRNSSSYGDMVQRRLEREGKDPANFELQPRSWGTRIPNTPFIEHVKDGVTKHYLEVIFVRAGQSTYFLDGQPIAKADIVGLKVPTVKEEAQGGLEAKVIIRTFSLDSITAIRLDGNEYDIR
jgi:hypothetical protein